MNDEGTEVRTGELRFNSDKGVILINEEGDGLFLFCTWYRGNNSPTLVRCYNSQPQTMISIPVDSRLPRVWNASCLEDRPNIVLVKNHLVLHGYDAKVWWVGDTDE